jgi:hypothetical protein
LNTNLKNQSYENAAPPTRSESHILLVNTFF